jgi:hypothetical protein
MIGSLERKNSEQKIKPFVWPMFTFEIAARISRAALFFNSITENTRYTVYHYL